MTSGKFDPSKLASTMLSSVDFASLELRVLSQTPWAHTLWQEHMDYCRKQLDQHMALSKSQMFGLAYGKGAGGGSGPLKARLLYIAGDVITESEPVDGVVTFNIRKKRAVQLGENLASQQCELFP